MNEQKSPWPWIIGTIILAGLLWYILTYLYAPYDNRNQVIKAGSTYTGNNYGVLVDTLNEVKDFITFSKDTSKPKNPKRYTERGLIKLQSALSFLADRVDSSNNSVIDKNLDSLDREVAQIDTSSNNYLSELKPAFSSALKVIASIQKLKYPDLAENISKLKNSENNIDMKSSVDSQLTKIRQFYNLAGNTLEKMKSDYI